MGVFQTGLLGRAWDSEGLPRGYCSDEGAAQEEELWVSDPLVTVLHFRAL